MGVTWGVTWGVICWHPFFERRSAVLIIVILNWQESGFWCLSTGRHTASLFCGLCLCFVFCGLCLCLCLVACCLCFVFCGFFLCLPLPSLGQNQCLTLTLTLRLGHSAVTPCFPFFQIVLFFKPGHVVMFYFPYNLKCEFESC